MLVSADSDREEFVIVSDVASVGKQNPLNETFGRSESFCLHRRSDSKPDSHGHETCASNLQNTRFSAAVCRKHADEPQQSFSF